MYAEELWKNVRIEKETIVSDDGLESSSLQKETIENLANKLGYKVQFYKLNEFSVMAMMSK